ncbi:MSEP-CTERM sorting domain-containing protein [Hymenobacter sp. BT559]|uniref:MSEP-CTERM sorting domain-containing protein n=1 Tax=Hymenobacter sp. BT559 TaxID=2795729 RepID=UPI0018EAA573|nr:MSEP-CTERM sorting domain-containing protein [Hymenobacter sp. BT559]MBJ6145657.1 MSEP-CTERM sorting domain-containing protein [Hymenobacter sp. BT559]
MRNLLNPKWLLLVTVGPLLLLAVLCYGEFSIIHSLLPPQSIELWQRFGWSLGGLGLASLGYLGWAWAHKQEVSPWYALAALIAYSLFVGLYTYHADEALPRSIPRWMVPTDILIYIWTFVMPTLAHALLVLVVRFTPAGRPYSALANLGLAVAVPVGAWLALGMMMGLWGLMSGWFEPGTPSGYAWVIGVFAVGPLLFLFFLVRAVYILSLSQEKEWADYSIIWKVVLTIVLPVLGLAVNSGLLFGHFSTDTQEGIFGNFNSFWFYGLAVLNGVLLCLPAGRLGPHGRLALLGARSALFGYTGYFFLVFLPFLPLSLVAVIAIGSGFLMLAPLMLLVVHVTTLHDDLGALQAHFTPLVRRAVLVGGLAVLPLGLTGSYWHQRQVLHEALEYTYSPDYTKHYDLDAAALAYTLAVVQRHKDTNWDLFMGSQQPYLSAYYNWLVLDNLTLPESKIADLQKIFVGTEPLAGRPRWSRWVPGTNFAEDQGPTTAQPTLRQLTARSTYNAKEQAWVSWVDLAVANTDASRQAEYSTVLTLPPGCWVGNYYLDIGQRREFGILAERKAATWVYTQIVNERSSRDPGLLSYIGPNQLSLRVYPVVGKEVRRTGIQLLHKEPLTLAVDGRTVQLGTPDAAPANVVPLATSGSAVVYLGAAAKRQLPLVQRRPYYHFLLDASQAQAGAKASYVQRVQALLRTQPLAAPPRFSLVNTYTTPLGEGTDWPQALTKFKNIGGCYLTGAVRRTLTAAQLHSTATYPRLVVVTDSLGNAVLPADFADLQAAYPESDDFYVLLPDCRLEAHSLRQASATARASVPSVSSTVSAVRAWPNASRAQAYLRDTNEPALVLPHPADPLAVPGEASTRWLTGLLLHGFEQWQSLHPEAAEQGHVPFIQASFRAGILTPLTAYLALENDAQKAALQRKQEEVLAANLNLDAQETEPPHPNSDATAVPLDGGQWFLLLLGLALGVRQLRQRYRVAG